MSILDNLFFHRIFRNGALVVDKPQAIEFYDSNDNVVINTANGRTRIDVSNLGGGGGAPLTTDPPEDIFKQTAAAGAASSAARADHKHAIATAAAGSATPGDSAAEGAATSLARSDHKHALPAFGTSAGTFCVGNDARLPPTPSAAGRMPFSNGTTMSETATPHTGAWKMWTGATWEMMGSVASVVTANANTTIAPTSDAKDTYILRTSQLTASRNLTIDLTGFDTKQAITLVVDKRNGSNFSWVIKNLAGTTILDMSAKTTGAEIHIMYDGSDGILASFKLRDR